MRIVKLRPATIITWIATLAIVGGLVRLALDDEVAEVALPEPQPASGAPRPAELASSLVAAISRSGGE